MKSAEEWKSHFLNLIGEDDPTVLYIRITEEEIAKIQADAFHAGELKGLADARAIVRQYGAPKESDSYLDAYTHPTRDVD